MSYPNVWLHVLNGISDLIQIGNDNMDENNCLAAATGAHDVLFTPKYLKKYGIKTISSDDMLNHMTNDRVAYAKSSNELARKVLMSYGYSDYHDIDIYDRANIVCNLSKPIPQKYHKKYDLVLDITSTYVTNIIQSYNNTSQMTKVGGKKVVVTTIGDHTNRFDLNPSPNFLVDFHVSNGFILERAFIINPKGKKLPYKRYASKSTPAFALLPISAVVVTFIKSLYTFVTVRSGIRNSEIMVYPMNFGDKRITQFDNGPDGTGESKKDFSSKGVRSRVKMILKTILGEKLFSKIILINRKYRYIRRAFLHSNLSNEWYAYFVFKKTKESNEINFHITSHYSKLDQT